MAFYELPEGKNPWPPASVTSLFANPYLKVSSVLQGTPTRPEGVHWTVAHRPAGCVVAPMTARGGFLLVEQERVPVRRSLWEFPAGQVDASGRLDEATLRATALRELAEETGSTLAPGGELIALGTFFPSAGFSDEWCHLYLARPVVPTADGPRYDAGEAITACREFSPQELREAIARGEVCDANTLATFARMTALGLWPGGDLGVTGL